MEKYNPVQESRDLYDQLRDSITSWGVANFGSIREYHKWLHEPTKVLGGSRPSSMFDTMERMKLLLLVLQQKYHSINNPK